VRCADILPALFISLAQCLRNQRIEIRSLRTEDCARFAYRRFEVMGLILLIVLIILLLGAVPAWPYSRNWGYGPSGGLGLLVLIIIILLLLHVF
jgi:hypothetical protein